MAPVQKVSDLIFRSDSVGPAFGNIVASLMMAVVLQAVVQKYVVQPWAASLDVLLLEHESGFLAVVGVCTFSFFWLCGFVMALPAMLRMKRWKIQVNKEIDFVMLWKSLPVVIFNSLGFLPIGFGFRNLLPASSWDFSALPSISTLTVQLAVILAVQEVMFFYSHRWLHENKTMYARVHKLHHTWTAPISVVAIYAHPFEHAISNLLPPLAGYLLVRAHFATIAIHSVVGIVHTLAVHSGFFFCDDNGMHDEHHRRFNVNFGVFGILDWLHGSYSLPPTAKPHCANSGNESASVSKNKAN